MIAAAPAAKAATYITQLNWDASGSVAPQSFGTVTVKEMTPYELQVTVNLTDGKFVDNGNGNWFFTFGMNAGAEAALGQTINGVLGRVVVDPSSTITAANGAVFDPTGGNGGNAYSPALGYTDATWGTFANAWQLPNGGNNRVSGPFIFDIYDGNGITFAGVGATTDPTTGKLLTLGAGDHLISNTTGANIGQPPPNPGGWWFAADTYNATTANGTTACANTCTVAGRDAFIEVAVPEPTAWALMIMGFGGIGAMMRRRRVAIA
ncbi:MAG: PEP-CTERM sorting domain-containing protein [Proteobacteria bacterium]|nr:PEP-CTERM sorting domain-containing protein [Pseudomonadota bacterium]